MKKEIGFVVAMVLLFSGISYAGLFGKSDKEVEEEIKKKEVVLTASFNETLAQKNKEIAEKNTEIEKLKLENSKLTADMEEANKKLEKMEQEKSAAPPVVQKVEETRTPEETRTLEEIITTEMTKYAQVVSSAEELKVTFNTDFFFYFDVLEPVIYRSLDVILQALKTYPDHRIIITGYTDSIGDKKTNLKTSLIKAKAVANYLIAKGIPEEKMIVKSLGSADPIDTNKTKEGRKQNRRVEVIIR